MTKKVVVTGGAGFIGSHLCRALLDQGSHVVAIDNFDPFYPREIKERGISTILERDGFQLVEADIRNTPVVTEIFEGASSVVHLAARAGVRPSIDDPQGYMSVNVEGTASVLEACRLSGVTNFVFGSSSSVYGDSTPAPFREDAPALCPISPYAESKRAGEHLCTTFAGLYGMSIASLRFFTVYGDRQRPDLAIHKFTRIISSGERITRFGDGSTERDYTYVTDIVQGVMGALEWLEEAGTGVEVFNLGESQTITLSYLIELIGESLGIEPAIVTAPEQPGDVKRTCADVTKARRVLGYDPRVSMEKGIPLFVKWYNETYGYTAPTIS